MAQALGTTDTVTTCDCCGKSGLKLTVAIQLDSGEIAHYGTTCATRNTGKTPVQITSEIATARALRVEAARKEYRASPEYLALTVKLFQRPRTLLGKAAADFIRAESTAEFAVRQRICAHHNVMGFEL